MATPEENDALVKAARRDAERERRAREDDRSSVGRKLAQIGVLGWMIVTPALIGLFVGRWLDRALQSGLFWTAPLLLAGLALGCWSAWKWVEKS
jgi:ATP synthase protein I